MGDAPKGSRLALVMAERDRIRERLAAIEPHILIREDLEAQGYEVPATAIAWHKAGDVPPHWIEYMSVGASAPDLRPNDDSAVTLSIITLRDCMLEQSNE